MLQKRVWTTARNPENFKVIGQWSRSQDQIFDFFTRAKKLVCTMTDEPLDDLVWSAGEDAGGERAGVGDA